jgi:hypothetical protein
MDQFKQKLLSILKRLSLQDHPTLPQINPPPAASLQLVARPNEFIQAD